MKNKTIFRTLWVWMLFLFVGTVYAETVTTQEGLQAAIQAATDGDVITLGEGTYYISGLSKDLTIVGQGSSSTKVVIGSNGDGNQGTGIFVQNLTLKNLSLSQNPTSTYTGFTGGKNLCFEDVQFDYGFSNWGNTGNSRVEFVSCTFNQAEQGKYCVQELRSGNGTSFLFDDCTFNCTKEGRFINAYKQGGKGVKMEITCKKCTFNNTGSSSKAVFNLKDESNGCSIDMTFVGTNTTTGEYPSSAPSSLFQTTATGWGTVYLKDSDDAEPIKIYENNAKTASWVDPDGYVATPPAPTGYNGAVLPEGPDMTGTIINVTAANAQYVLDGAYGSIDNKTINFTQNITEKLVIGRPTKYAGSNTQYRHGSFSNDPLSYDDFIAYKNQQGWTEYSYYVRTIENVKFTSNEGVTLAGFETKGGSHVYGTDKTPIYDYVRDNGTMCDNTNNGYYFKLLLSGATFEGLSFTQQQEFATSNDLTVIDKVTFKECSFTTGGTASSNGAAIHYVNWSNNTQQNVKYLVVENCTFNNVYQGVYTSGVNGITIKDCTVSTTGHNAFAIQSGSNACNHGDVVITGNTITGCGDRAIRFDKVGADTRIVISGNTASYGDGTTPSNEEAIKATSIADGVTITAYKNDWKNFKTPFNKEFEDIPAVSVGAPEVPTIEEGASDEDVNEAIGDAPIEIIEDNESDITTEEKVAALEAVAEAIESITGNTEAFEPIIEGEGDDAKTSVEAAVDNNESKGEILDGMISNEDLDEDTKTALEAAKEDENADIHTYLVIELTNVTVDTTPQEGETPASAEIKKITFEVTPKATIIANGQAVTTTIPNAAIEDEIKFRLPVPTSIAAVGKNVLVRHNDVVMTGTFTVQEGNYVEVASSSFSPFSIEPASAVKIDGEYVQISTNANSPLVLTDAIKSLEVEQDIDNVDIQYTRNFNGNIEALYLPFDYTLTTTDLDAFDFGQISGITTVGEADAIEYTKLAAGDKLTANTPYFVKKNVAGSHTFSATGLKQTVRNNVVKSTTEKDYVFTGIYDNIQLTGNPYWAIDNNGQMSFAKADGNTYIVNPFRFVMRIYDHTTHVIIDPHATQNANMLILTDDEATAIREIRKAERHDGIIYDLSGRRVTTPTQGMYIKDGKKIIVK